MLIKNIKTNLLIAGGAVIIFGSSLSPVMAQSVSPVKEVKQKQSVDTLKARGDNEIAKRITSLNSAIATVNAAKKLSDTQKQTLVTNDQNNISTLNSLKTKIDTDTDLETLRSDVKSIFTSVRVYMLVLPQESIIRAADRQLDIANDLTVLADKLNTRILDAQSHGHDVSALQASLTDLRTKIADAQPKANGAINSVVNLKPDQGDTGVIASNKQALESAHANVKIGHTDIQAAYNDAKSIVAALKLIK